MTWPQPTRQAHESFCHVEKWDRVRDARGRTGTHHVTYELHLKDGRILRTRISHPVDRTSYGPGIWSHILRDQLDVTEIEFWTCVQDGIKPDRGEPEVPAEALPADLVYLLIHRVGLAGAAVAAMTKDEAVARLNRYWAEGS
ncbi:cytotoxic translational repressor of toxin-antitoxin stability system [Catellatospora paridis]|uniref:cytotoxic translational repressor of toxin-antitoxin stability system n=1 Tax=Catellatospora paridis TaxID=1617086 RepID=UPI0012D4645C|nr:cytotoxic translational repressor of toxin-antitoxin stability system [Catellatospora paridis]